MNKQVEEIKVTMSEIWHDVGEEPKKGTWLICDTHYGLFDHCVYGSPYCEGFAQVFPGDVANVYRLNAVKKWAYLKDLRNLSNVERTGKNCKDITNSAKNSKKLQENEDLEQEIEQYMNHNYYVDEEGVICDRNHPRLDFCEDKFKEVARHFANWQKQQMMRDAVDATIPIHGQIWIDNNTGYKAGDKVKVIITKED